MTSIYDLEATISALKRAIAERDSVIAGLRAQVERVDEGARLRMVVAEQRAGACRSAWDEPCACASCVRRVSPCIWPKCACETPCAPDPDGTDDLAPIEAHVVVGDRGPPIVLAPPRKPRAPTISDARHPGYAAHVARVHPPSEEP